MNAPLSRYRTISCCNAALLGWVLFVGTACGNDEATVDTECPLDANRLSELDAEWENALAAHANCVNAGGDCASVDYISCDMAMCVASEHGLGEGIAPWECSIVHHGAYDRVVWNVSNTEFSEPGGRGESTGGTSFAIDARTGRFLRETSWARMP